MKKTSLRLLPIIIILSISTTATYAGNGNGSCFSESPKREVRAVWLTTIGGLDWPHSYAQSEASIEKQKNELATILDRLKSMNFNTILLQTRIRATVIYPSMIEPWDGCMSGIPGQSPGYDPLQFAVEECHKRGMEIHAWIVAVPAGKWNGYGCKTLRKKHPNLLIKNFAEGYFNPNNPLVSSYIASICKEVTLNYDIDGIHLDYIRYPETMKANVAPTKARNNITKIVEEVSRTVKKLKPWVKVSCASIGKYNDLNRYSSRGWNAYTKCYQDVRNWLSRGLIDQLYPMVYFRGDNFYPFVSDWNENCYGKSIIPGLGIYFLSPKEGNWTLDDVERQMYFSRSQGMGYCFFRNKFLMDNTKGIMSFTKDIFNRYPALIPIMNNFERTVEAPDYIQFRKIEGCHILQWSRINDTNDGGILYNVYASSTYPVDTDKPQNIIAQRMHNNYLILKSSQNLYYAVTSMDRYGNESQARQLPVKYEDRTNIQFIKNDGYKMMLPDKGQTLDAEFIILKSLTGNIVTTLPYRGKYADISKIKEGVYTIYSLNHKDVTHRLGFVYIRRYKNF